MNNYTLFKSKLHNIKYLYSILLILFLPLSCKKNTNKHDVSIKKSFEYIRERGGKFDASTGLFIGFLSKKFEQANIPKLTDVYDSMNIFNEHPSTKLYQRLVRSHSISKEDIEQYRASIPLNRLQYIMLAGMYCDQVPLTDDFSQKVKQQTDLDGYFLTHAALSIHFTKCLKCPISDELKSIENQQIQLLKQLIETTDIQDLKYETIAILKLMRPHTQIKQEWVKEILDLQLEDGGWARVSQLKTSNDHTTLLALWVLLESKYPKVKPVCMVQ